MVIGLIAAGRLKLQGATIVLDGQALNAPIVEDEQHAQRPVNAGAHA
jgi:hypothetical protein